jgi:hypothetical protein
MAHAESAAMLGNAEEATTYQEKALDLMAEHAVTQAMLDVDAVRGGGVAVLRIMADELPSPYSLEYGYGILKLARALGGYGLLTRWQGARLPTQVDVAIADPEPFRRVALGLAGICALGCATHGSSRLERASFVRGFWDGCAAAATLRVTQYEQTHGGTGALVPVRDTAKETLTEALGDTGTIRRRKTPPSAQTYLTGRREGRDSYRSFGHTLGND